MAQINEAYGLSDPDQRPEYDRLREKRTQGADTAFADGDEEPTTRSPLDEDWQTAVQFYPELGPSGDSAPRKTGSTDSARHCLSVQHG